MVLRRPGPAAGSTFARSSARPTRPPPADRCSRGLRSVACAARAIWWPEKRLWLRWLVADRAAGASLGERPCPGPRPCVAGTFRHRLENPRADCRRRKDGFGLLLEAVEECAYVTVPVQRTAGKVNRYVVDLLRHAASDVLGGRPSQGDGSGLLLASKSRTRGLGPWQPQLIRRVGRDQVGAARDRLPCDHACRADQISCCRPCPANAQAIDRKRVRASIPLKSPYQHIRRGPPVAGCVHAADAYSS